MTIEEEIDHLGVLKYPGMALVQFTRALFRGDFKKKSAAWIYSPNFAGLEIRYVRAERLNILFRRITLSAEPLRVLPVSKGPLTYWRAEVSSVRQLPAALGYIEASWRDWYREIFREEPKL